MTTPFDNFERKKAYLICADSDGCAMDTMDIKPELFTQAHPIAPKLKSSNTFQLLSISSVK